jgi:hypothetical protein
MVKPKFSTLKEMYRLRHAHCLSKTFYFHHNELFGCTVFKKLFLLGQHSGSLSTSAARIEVSKGFRLGRGLHSVLKYPTSLFLNLYFRQDLGGKLVRDFTTRCGTPQSRPVGIFWDVDNIRPKVGSDTASVEDHVSALRQFARDIGEITAFQAFGNASTLTSGAARKSVALSTALRRHGVGCVRTNISKNAADSRLIAAARGWIAEHGAGACMVLVTCDADFGPLAAEARRRGLAVVAATFNRAPARRLTGESDLLFTLRTGAVDPLSQLGLSLQSEIASGDARRLAAQLRRELRARRAAAAAAAAADYEVDDAGCELGAGEPDRADGLGRVGGGDGDGEEEVSEQDGGHYAWSTHRGWRRRHLSIDDDDDDDDIDDDGDDDGDDGDDDDGGDHN